MKTFLLTCLLALSTFAQESGINRPVPPFDAPPLPKQLENAIPPDVQLNRWSGIADLLNLKALELKPKVISLTDNNETTLGIEYKYDRHFTNSYQLGGRDLEFSLHSEGTFTIDEEQTPTRMLRHGLGLTLIDILPARRGKDAETQARRAFNQRFDTEYNLPWLQRKVALEDLHDEREELQTQLGGAPGDDAAANRSRLREIDGEISEIEAEMMKLAEGAATMLEPYGTLNVSENGDLVFENGNRAVDELINSVRKARPIFLSWDVDADAETDQRFEDVQLVGSTQIRGKFLIDWFDTPFKLIRGYEHPKDFRNSSGGPLFAVGIGLVDPSGNDSRKAIDPDDDIFARAHARLWYRTEVFQISEDKFLSLELSWNYYHEFDAPNGIRSAGLDELSFFKGTLYFPGDLFIEYSSGQLPIDIENSTAIAGGWKFNF